MSCKVYTGDASNNQSVKIVCSNFNTAITSSMTVKFGFWVVNPSSTTGMAIPVTIYAYNQNGGNKYIWSIIEAGIRILPSLASPIADLGNFYISSSAREAQNINF